MSKDLKRLRMKVLEGMDLKANRMDWLEAF